MPFQIIRNDITKVKADAIVNTANPRPYYAAGTDSAIYEAAGAEALLRARKKIGDIAPGQAAVTKAFALNARYIIHTVGPLWRDGEHASPYGAYLAAASFAALLCGTRDLSRLSDRGFDFRPDYEKGSGRAPQALEDRTAEEVDLDPTLTARIREAVAAARF